MLKLPISHICLSPVVVGVWDALTMVLCAGSVGCTHYGAVCWESGMHSLWCCVLGEWDALTMVLCAGSVGCFHYGADDNTIFTSDDVNRVNLKSCRIGNFSLHVSLDSVDKIAKIIGHWYTTVADE